MFQGILTTILHFLLSTIFLIFTRKSWVTGEWEGDSENLDGFKVDSTKGCNKFSFKINVKCLVSALTGKGTIEFLDGPHAGTKIKISVVGYTKDTNQILFYKSKGVTKYMIGSCVFNTDQHCITEVTGHGVGTGLQDSIRVSSITLNKTTVTS